MTFDDFVQATKAEVCGGHVVVGVGANRRSLGKLADSGAFELTEEGQIVMHKLNAGDEALAALAEAQAALAAKAKAAQPVASVQ